MDRRCLEAFVAVVDAGGYQAAAKALHLSQPGVSRRILSLEAQTRFSLLERSNRGVTLTPQGREMLPVARRVLLVLDEAEDSLRRIRVDRSRRPGSDTSAN